MTSAHLPSRFGNNNCLRLLLLQNSFKARRQTSPIIATENGISAFTLSIWKYQLYSNLLQNSFKARHALQLECHWRSVGSKSIKMLANCVAVMCFAFGKNAGELCSSHVLGVRCIGSKSILCSSHLLQFLDGLVQKGIPCLECWRSVKQSSASIP
jgi:hypothetical protein